MTQRQPRQPDQALSESAPRAVHHQSDAELDARIRDSLCRLYQPPTAGRPLFNGTARASLRRAAADDGNAEGRLRLAEASSDTPPRDDRPRPLLWLQRAAIAACLILGVFGVWNSWRHLSIMYDRTRQPPPTLMADPVYFEIVEKGFRPTSEFAVDARGRRLIPGTPMSIAPSEAERATEAIEFVGVHDAGGLETDSPLLLLRVEERPVVLFAGADRHLYGLTDAQSAHLHLHHRSVGRFQVYELTPYANPAILGHVECEGPECSVPSSQCAIETYPRDEQK